MKAVILAIHCLVIIALIVLVLLQRSEGGVMGASSRSFMTGRSQADGLSRLTAILGALFFSSAILLSVLSDGHANSYKAVPPPPLIPIK